MAKKSKKFVDLDADDEDDMEELSMCVNRKWNKDEEKLLVEIWVEVYQDKDIGNDRSDDFFWNQTLEIFNLRSDREPHGKNMLTGKWTSINGDCKKFNVVYKHLQRRNDENDHDHLENAKTNFEQRFGNKSFMCVHVWEILRNCPKRDAEDPIDIAYLEDIFDPDKRPRPDGAKKSRASKKQMSTDTSSTSSSEGSQTSSFSGHLSEKYSQKADIQMAAYDARRPKELKTLEMEEMKFLMIDLDQTIPTKAAIIRKRQEQIMQKYQIDEEDAY